MSVFLGIDTSNYTTSVAAFDNENNIMVSEKKLLPVSQSACGLRQSDAVFHHVKQLAEVSRSVISKIGKPPSAIGFSISPCDFEGSYMPCFLVGKMVAEILQAVYNAKIYSFSHQRGHIAAALYSVDNIKMLESEFIALHISGGTTDILKVCPDKEKIIKVECIGKSLDLKAGQAVDRVGVMLGLSFPCGANLEKMALESDKTFKIKPFVKGFDCSLSGIENIAKKMYDCGECHNDIAKFCLDYIGESIFKVCENVKNDYPELPFVFAGGVMSNGALQTKLKEKFGGFFAKPQYSSDNAAGISILCKIAFERNLVEFQG